MQIDPFTDAAAARSGVVHVQRAGRRARAEIGDEPGALQATAARRPGLDSHP